MAALWIGLAWALSAITTRSRDWYDMTDELRYERLAISIARTHSLVPRTHGVDIHSFSQLYPLLIAPAFAHGFVPHDLHVAHLLNAWIMSSACIPAFLLARRVTGRWWQAYVVALLAVCMPWILYSTMLMTEVAAYPAFLWAVLALQRATTEPSARRDVVALAAVALAYFARAELIVLLVVPPLAMVAYEIGRGRIDGSARLGDVLRQSVRSHRVVVGAYGIVVVAAVTLALAGRLASVVGVYGIYAVSSSLLPAGFFGSLAEHAATFSLGLGILPFLVGSAWLGSNLLRPARSRETHAFACIGSTVVAAVLLQSTEFDVRWTGYVHDRFLLYLAPVVVLGTLCALDDRRRPRWSLSCPVALVAAGFAAGAFGGPWRQFSMLDPDSPISGLFRRIVQASHGLGVARVLLVSATVLLAVMFVFWSHLLGHRRFTVVVTALLLLAVPATTGYMFTRLFRGNGWSGRPLVRQESGIFNAFDETIGPNAAVTMVPYPTLPGDYLDSQRVWRDLEFWNKSVVRDVHLPNRAFEYTGVWFPKLYPAFNDRTGTTSVSPTRYVAQSDKETRFRIAGTVRATSQDIVLIDAGQPWHLQWLTSGLYDDGWTRPGVAAQIRVFAYPGQRGAVSRSIAVGVAAPSDITTRPFRIVSNLGTWSGPATNRNTVFRFVTLCVPAHGFAVARLSTPDDSTVYGDLGTQDESGIPRQAGVFLSQIALADEIGSSCTPGRAE